MQPAFNLPQKTPFNMDDVIYTFVEPKHVREKVQREFKMLMRLRMAIYLSVLTSSDDEIMDDPRVQQRINDLLDVIRIHSPSLNFARNYVETPGELCRGFCLMANRSGTSATLIKQRNNVISLAEFGGAA